MKKQFLLIAGLVIFLVAGADAQQLTYKSRALGNEDFKCPGTHMQNHIYRMQVDPGGKCVTWSEWDEGGHPQSAYQNGKYIGSAPYNADNRSVKDKNGKTWTIQNYFGRFLSQLSCPGGLGCQGDAAKAYANWTKPVPTGASAPYIKCSDGREIRDVVDPSAIGLNYHTGELMVYENSIDQYVRIYNISGATATLSKTFGVKGGVWAGSNPGRMDDPLKFAGVTGIGADTTGIIYVGISGVNAWGGSGGGSEIRAFNTNSTLKWRMRGQIFLSSGCPDPSTNGIDIYTGYYHFRMDYSKPTGSDWEAYALTVNPFKYPDDPRLVCSVEDGFSIKVINGIKYMWATEQYRNGVTVYRFDGEIAVPCAAFCAAYGWNGDEFGRFIWHWNMNRPALPRWLWCDRNGNGIGDDGEFESYEVGQAVGALDVDNDGNVYLGSGDGGVYKFPANGFDKYGNPQYSAASMTLFASIPHSVGSMKWVQDADMLVCGNGGDISTVDVYKNWSNPSTRAKAFSVNLPAVAAGSGSARQVTADKDYFYVSYAVTSGPNTKKTGEIDVYSMIDGAVVGYITPGPEIGSCSGWIDMAEPTKVFVTYEGKRIVVTEEDWVGKILVYEWCPSGNCDQLCTQNVTSVSITPPNLSLTGLDSTFVSATVNPENVCYKGVSWSSSNNKIVTIDYKGKVTSVGVGSAWIIATSVQQPELADSCLVTVNNVPVAGIKFNPESLNVPLGSLKQLVVDFLPVNTANRNLNWSSVNPAIASVDTMGVVKGLQVGKSDIVAVSPDGGYTDTCHITVILVPVASIDLVNSKNVVWQSQTVKLETVILPGNAFNKTVFWESANTSIATVDGSGNVTGISPGSIKIRVTAQDGGLKDSCYLQVVAEGGLGDVQVGKACTQGSVVSSNGVYTILAGGIDIYGKTDEFHYAFQNFAGNGMVMARVNAPFTGDAWAKAGVMIRETRAAGAKHAMMVVTPGFGTSLQYRKANDDISANTTPGDGKKAPYWVKIKRVGDVFTGYKSVDGNTWTPVGTVTIPMQPNVLIGICLTSHAGCSSTTAKFDNVIVSANPDYVYTNVNQTYASDIQIFPNPTTNGYVAITGLKHGKAVVTITDFVGKLVYNKLLETNGDLILNEILLSPGIYMIGIKNEGIVFNSKLIVQ